MPEVMLRRDWPGVFRRTVPQGRKSIRMEFEPGVPIDLNAAQIEAVKSDIGVALMPCDRDEKGRARLITDEVDVEQEAPNDAIPV